MRKEKWRFLSVSLAKWFDKLAVRRANSRHDGEPKRGAHRHAGNRARKETRQNANASEHEQLVAVDRGAVGAVGHEPGDDVEPESVDLPEVL